MAKVQSNIPATAARTDYDQVVFEAATAGTISEVTYVSEGAVTGAASPRSRTLSLVNVGADGRGTTEIARLALVRETDLVAHDEARLTLSSRAEELNLAAGDVVVWKSLATTTEEGLADPGGLVQVTTTASAVEATRPNTGVVGYAESVTTGYFGARPNQTHADAEYGLLTGPNSPTGARGPE